MQGRTTTIRHMANDIYVRRTNELSKIEVLVVEKEEVYATLLLVLL